MTRRLLLSSTALAALLAAGGPVPFTPLPVRARQRAEAAAPRAPTTLALAGRLLAVVLPERLPDDGVLPVAVQVEGVLPDPLLLWVGRKNGWGSPVTAAEPSPGLPGFASARVAVARPVLPGARLWLGAARADGVLERAALPLPI